VSDGNVDTEFSSVSEAIVADPRVSKEAKQHAEQVLKEHGADY